MRPDFLRRSLAALDRARAQGVDLRGYFHWSLYDNFEWADGHEGRFGLYAADFDNPAAARVKRASAEVMRREVSERVTPRHN
jgi:beta-glucosidase